MVSLIIASYEVDPYHEVMMEEEEKSMIVVSWIYEAMKVMVCMKIQ